MTSFIHGYGAENVPYSLEAVIVRTDASHERTFPNTEDSEEDSVVVFAIIWSELFKLVNLELFPVAVSVVVVPDVVDVDDVIGFVVPATMIEEMDTGVFTATRSSASIDKETITLQ